MITDKDIKKMKAVFATKDEMSSGFRELVKFIGETRIDIMTLLSKQINDFREEMRDINRNTQSTLNNHETRINHLEYINKI